MASRPTTAWLVPALTFAVMLGTAFFTPAFQARARQTPPDGAANGTVWNGVYTEAQAERGRIGYTAHCSGCHRGDLSGYNGVLEGNRFMTHWREDVLDSLFRNIKTTMPRGAAGSLGDDEYLDIVAYLLQANTFPAGGEELKRETLNRIRVTAKEGPQPLPAGAWVEVVGCLTQDSNAAWILTNATEPIRTQGFPSAEDLKAEETRPLGTRTFELLDVNTRNPALHNHHRMDARGFLILSPKDRLNLTSLTMVAAACEP